MSNPDNFFNFESSSDSPSQLPNQLLLELLNNHSAQDGQLVNAPDSGSGNVPPTALAFPVEQLGFLPVQRPIPPPPQLDATDDFLEMLKANACHASEAQVHGAEGVEGNEVASTTPPLTRTISEVTMEMLHRTPFANVTINQANQSMSVPNAFASNGQQERAPSNIGAIQAVHQGKLAPAPPLQQAVSAPQHGKDDTSGAQPNGLVVPDGGFISVPLKPGHAHNGLGTKPVELRLLQPAEQRTPQPVSKPSVDVGRAVSGQLPPAGHPSGTLQAAQKGDGDVPAQGMSGREARGGAVVRRVLKRMAKRNSDVPAVLSRICEEQSQQDSVDGKPELEGEEKRGKKRKIEGVENEEELKKLRRVRNRESVEKCRAKQRMRLEKLEEEDRALRSECEKMRQMAEVFQEKWKQVAAEYQKICGKDAGECPIAIPPDMQLPEIATLSAGD